MPKSISPRRYLPTVESSGAKKNTGQKKTPSSWVLNSSQSARIKAFGSWLWPHWTCCQGRIMNETTGIVLERHFCRKTENSPKSTIWNGTWSLLVSRMQELLYWKWADMSLMQVVYRYRQQFNDLMLLRWRSAWLHHAESRKCQPFVGVSNTVVRGISKAPKRRIHHCQFSRRQYGC